MKKKSDIPPLIKRLHLDNSCEIDSDVVQSSDRDEYFQMKDSMSVMCSLRELSLAYPEYNFGFVEGKKPAGHAITQRFKNGWRYADWRTK